MQSFMKNKKSNVSGKQKSQCIFLPTSPVLITIDCTSLKNLVNNKKEFNFPGPIGKNIFHNDPGFLYA